MDDAKEDLRRYLRLAHEALVWKLDGLDEYDIRRPLVPTGTNLLGLIKHCASVEAGYLGEVFGRLADLTRHAGHADIVRELIDGSAGLRPDNSNLPDGDAAWWASYVERLEATAQSFRTG